MNKNRSKATTINILELQPYQNNKIV